MVGTSPSGQNSAAFRRSPVARRTSPPGRQAPRTEQRPDAHAPEHEGRRPADGQAADHTDNANRHEPAEPDDHPDVPPKRDEPEPEPELIELEA